MAGNKTLFDVACNCGKVRIEAVGKPFLLVDCHCKSCRRAAAGFNRLPGSPRVLNANGGTPFAMFRKDQLAFVRGVYLMEEHRLTENSTTRRILSTCCCSPMFLEFEGGHWLSVYRDRIADAGPAEMRVMTADQRGCEGLPGDLPNFRTHSPKFWWRLFSAWVAMGFRAPKVPI